MLEEPRWLKQAITLIIYFPISLNSYLKLFDYHLSINSCYKMAGKRMFFSLQIYNSAVFENFAAL